MELATSATSAISATSATSAILATTTCLVPVLVVEGDVQVYIGELARVLLDQLCQVNDGVAHQQVVLKPVLYVHIHLHF